MSSHRKSPSSMGVGSKNAPPAKKAVSWTEKEAVVKQKKEAPTKSATESFTDLFWHLANIHPDVRSQATATLIETLLSIEKQGKKSATTKNGFTNISDELDYTLGRLVRGLLSSRDAARQGFATALSETLKYLVVDLKEVSDYIVAEVVQAKSNPDSSTKDRRIGFVFGVGALIASGRVSEALSRSSTQSGTLQFVSRIASELVSNESLQQTPILELTIETLLQLLAQIPKAQVQSNILPSLSKALSTTSDGLQPEVLSLAFALQKNDGHHISSDNPQLWSKSETMFGAKNIRNLVLPLKVSVRTVPRLNKVWSHVLDALLVPSPSQQDDFARFCTVILNGLLKLDSIDHTYLVFKVAALFLPRLSATQLETLLTPELLNALFVSIPKRKSVVFPAARELVEAAIKAGKENHETALCILRRLTGPYGDLTVLDHFVKPGIMVSLVQSLDDEHLTKYAAEICDDIFEPFMPSDIIPRLEEVKSLEVSEVKEPASKKKKNATDMDVDEEVLDVPNETLELREVFVDPATWKATRQTSLVNHLQRVAVWTHTTRVGAVQKILNTLCFQAFYQCTTLPTAGDAKQLKKKKSEKSLSSTSSSVQDMMVTLKQTELPEKVREHISKVLLTILDAVKVPKAEEKANDDQEKKKLKKALGTVDRTPFQHAHFWVLPLVQFEKTLLDDSTHYAPITSGNALDDIRSTAENLMAKIEPVLKVSDETRRTRLEAMQALLIHLHMLINVELEDSIQSIQDLSRVFEELFMEKESAGAATPGSKKTPSKKTPSKSKAQMDVDEEGKQEAPEAIEVFTEILVALLMKANRSLRSVIEQNWVAFGSLIGESALDIVLTAFEEDQDVDGAGDGGDDEDELDDSDEALLNLAAGDLILRLDGDGDDQEAGSDGEDSDGKEGDDDDEEDGEDDDDLESSGDDDDDDEDTPMDEAARNKFKAVLQAAGAYQGSDDESEEMDFDDAKMFELDVGLAKVVKELEDAKNTSKRQREHKMTPLEIQASEFRVRLLGLIDLYVEQQTAHHHHRHHDKPSEEATPSKKGGKKANSKPNTPSKSHTDVAKSSPFHNTYLQVLWPLVRVADVIASKKSLRPLMTRVLASIHRFAKSKPHHSALSLDAKLSDSLYSLLSHLYSGFSQPSKPSQVDMRITLIVFLQKLLSQQEAPKIKKMRESFHAALKAYAESSQAAIKSRALFIDIFSQILKRNPTLHLVLLQGSGALLAGSKDGPTRASLALSLFSTLSKGVMESPEANVHGKVDFNDLAKEFVSVFKACFADSKIKPIHKKDFLARATDLFRTTLALNGGDLEKAQKAWNAKEVAKFASGHLDTNSLPIVTAAYDTFVSFIETGRAKNAPMRYASVEEKYKAKRERKLERLAKQQSKSKTDSSNSDKDKSKNKPVKSDKKKSGDKMDLSESDNKDSKRKARKTTSSSLDDSSSAPPAKKKAK